MTTELGEDSVSREEGLGLESVHYAYQMGVGRVRKEVGKEKLEKGKAAENILFALIQQQHTRYIPTKWGLGRVSVRNPYHYLKCVDKKAVSDRPLAQNKTI